jgi:hypothetical protein
MHSHLDNKVKTLMDNHQELTSLIGGERFQQFAVDTQLQLQDLHSLLDAAMRDMSAQVDALNRRVADLFMALEQ